ncbi:hypothetical protein N9J24_00295 [Bacteroidia bacterium]|nr:hypothetical protein [Bacteroidia bacterium]
MNDKVELLLLSFLEGVKVFPNTFFTSSATAWSNFYNNSALFIILGFEHQLLAAQQWSLAIGINLGVSEFKETSVHIQRNDGSIGDGNLNLQGLNKRVSSSTYMKINYDLGRISFFSKVGTQSIIKGLNPEQYSPNTILPNNSKASVLVNFGVGYNFEL